MRNTVESQTNVDTGGSGDQDKRVEFRLEPLLLKDVRVLLRHGLLHGTVSALKDRLGKSQRLFSTSQYVFWQLGHSAASPSQESGAEDAPLALIELFPEAENRHCARLDIRWSDAVREDVSTLSRCGEERFAEQLRELFYELDFWRVFIFLPQLSAAPVKMTETCLLDFGFKIEAVLPDHFQDISSPLPATLLAWSLRDPRNGLCFFLPFGEGLLIGRGDAEGLSAVDMRAFGTTCLDGRTYLWAYSLGLADREGRYRAANGNWQEAQEVLLKGAMSVAFRELKEYFAGKRRKFDIPLHEPEGSAFQKSVWEQLRLIPYGETRSYLDIARALTQQDEAQAHNICRAVGAACAANPLGVVVPCHRVIGSDRSLTGFNSGVSFKARLLDMELLGFRPR